MKFSNEQVVFRPMQQGDVNFIKDSWLKSCRSNPEFRYIKDEFFYANHKKVIEELLGHIYVVAFAEDPSVIIGYIAFDYINEDDHMIIHWACVKKTFRRMGVYRYMFNKIHEVIFDASLKPERYFFTHLPQDKYSFIVQNEYKRIGLLYNPYLRNAHENLHAE